MHRLGRFSVILTYSPAIKSLVSYCFSWPHSSGPWRLPPLCPSSSSLYLQLPLELQSYLTPFTIQPQALDFCWPTKLGRGFTWYQLTMWASVHQRQPHLEEAVLVLGYKLHQIHPLQDAVFLQFLDYQMLENVHEVPGGWLASWLPYCLWAAEVALNRCLRSYHTVFTLVTYFLWYQKPLLATNRFVVYRLDRFPHTPRS